MTRPGLRKAFTLLAVFFGSWLFIRYLLPVLLPFLLGSALALAAEPAVNFLCSRLRLPRGAAAGIGVSMTFLMLVLLLLLLGALLLRELSGLTVVVPQAQQMIQNGLTSLQDFLLNLASRAPDGLAGMLTQSVLELFSGGAALLSQVANKLLGIASGVLGRIPDSALGFGTGLISSFMISAKLPRIREYIRQRIPDPWKKKYLPAVAATKTTIFSYLRAQIKLMGITFLIVGAGLLLLRVRLAPLWAALIAVVDAVPLLGTGTVMLPWALVCLLQGNHILSIGLIGIYAAAAITRSVLEPRLIGRQMGIDPLLTLAALYLGYRLWGVLGMFLAPMAAATAIRLADLRTQSGH